MESYAMPLQTAMQQWLQIVIANYFNNYVNSSAAWYYVRKMGPNQTNHYYRSITSIHVTSFRCPS